jgi:hypothetical protein
MNLANLQVFLVSPTSPLFEGVPQARATGPSSWGPSSSDRREPNPDRTMARLLQEIRSDPQKCILESDAALEIDPRDARALFFRGMARHALGQYGLGLWDLQRAIALDIRLSRHCHCSEPFRRISAPVD